MGKNIQAVAFPIALFAFQILLLGLFAGYVDYEKQYTIENNQKVTTGKTAQNYYAAFQDVHVMIFIGFGFLMTFLKRYGFGAVSYNLLLSCIALQWATLLNAWMHHRMKANYKPGTVHNPSNIVVGYEQLMTADFTAAAVLITFGAVLGKASRLQLLIIVFFECIFFCINEGILMVYMKISDVGGSIVVHQFGAYFGLAVAGVIRNSEGNSRLEESTYQSDLFSMIGSIFLWIFWPSFNSGLLGNEPDRQRMAIVNTYYALAACVVTSFVMSALVEKRFKFSMVHVQNATIAGGVAVGTSADLMIKPWGAMLIGILAAVISVVGFTWITPFMTKTLKIHDTCGVHNLHGMPAVFAGICAAIASACISKDAYFGDDFKGIYSAGRSRKAQGGYQFAAILISFAIAVAGGILTGFVIRPLNRPPDEVYMDDPEWLVPDEEVQLSKSNADVQMDTVTANPVTQA